jgi:DNA-directed RNA polymerase subunit RPC12/RpoP
MEQPSQYMQEIVCPSCSSQGHATWEASDKAGGLRHLATVSDGFQVWPATDGHDPVIGCKKCGTRQRDQKDVGA